ncbi:MAG: tripartite tricarboxylate transporter TctB family protein [Desulfobacterales bacterium]|jgi:hypothetical protein
MKEDKVIGLILIAFSAFMYVQAERLPPALFGALGADFVPKILFIILAICGAVLMVQSLIRERKAKVSADDSQLENGGGGGLLSNTRVLLKSYQYVIFGFLAFLAYVILMYYLGYPIATLIFLPVIMWVLGPRNKKSVLVIILTTLGVTFIIYYSFLKFLKVFLPEGSLF